MNAGLVAQIQAGFAAVLADNAVSVVIRRGGVSLAAQTVRIAPGSNAAPHTQDTGSLQAVNRGVVIAGAPTLDIQPQDRFTHSGLLYEIEHVLPDRRFTTQALGRVVQ